MLDGLDLEMRGKGFTIRTKQSSTSGHAWFVQNMGIQFMDQGGFFRLWSTDKIPKSSSTNWVSHKHLFSASDIAEFKGWKMAAFFIQATTDSGSLTTTSGLRFGDLRLIWEVGISNDSGNRWLVGKRRSNKAAWTEAIQGV